MGSSAMKVLKIYELDNDTYEEIMSMDMHGEDLLDVICETSSDPVVYRQVFKDDVLDSVIEAIDGAFESGGLGI